MAKPTVTFPRFADYACEGDSVRVDVGALTLVARIYRDDCGDRPDQRQDGFWPSLDPKDAGYIGPRTARTLQRHMAKAQAIMDAWKRDEWFYCGVAVTVEKNGIQLTGDYGAALWGVECNYPGARGNAYLSEVASELADEAIAEATATLETLCDCDCE